METDKTQIVWNDFLKKSIERVFPYVERWYDEKEYEDIKDYRIHLDKMLKEIFPEKNTKVTKMYKRPFGFELHICDGIFKVQICISGNKYDVSAIIKKECNYV